jgi:hypothetical protein
MLGIIGFLIFLVGIIFCLLSGFHVIGSNTIDMLFGPMLPIGVLLMLIAMSLVLKQQNNNGR